ncbi:hypothetical protein RDABS01_021841 [Bienertia sinuspersici]
METHLDGEGVRRLCLALGFSYFDFSFLSTSTGGLAVLWSSQVTLQVTSKCQSFFFCEIAEGCTNQLAQWNLLLFYGSPYITNRPHVWDSVSHLLATSSLPCLIQGDFNQIKSIDQKWGGTDYIPGVRISLFTECLSLGVTMGTVTADCFNVWIGQLPPKIGYNSIQMLQSLISPSPCQSIALSCSTPNLLNKNVAHSVIGSPMFACTSKIKRVRYNMFKWCQRYMKKHHTMWGVLTAACTSVQLDVGSPISNFDEMHIRRQAIHDTTIKLNYWRQRAKGKWLELEDTNTTFFFRRAKIRKKRNEILLLQNSDGVWIHGKTEIQTLLVNHFKGIFRGVTIPLAPTTDWQPPPQDYVNLPKISPFQASVLIRTVSDDEFRQAVFQIGSLKAPGVDGIQRNSTTKCGLLSIRMLLQRIRTIYWRDHHLRQVTTCKSELGTVITDKVGKYLGNYIKVNGRSLSDYNDLVSRMRQTLLSWDHLCLFPAGRLLFANSILSSICTHILSIFLMPKYITKQLNSLICKFWWKGTLTGRPIYCKSRKILEQPKILGGLGLRNVEVLNKALLAKQAWRLDQQPTLLLARVYSTKYKMSAMAHGLLGGSTARTTWGFRSLSKSVQACRSGFGNTVVGDLFDSTTAEWKPSLICTHFTTTFVRAILSTHIPQTPIKDKLVWRLSPIGDLTTKSAYRLLTRDDTMYCARIHTSGIFIWRLVLNALPLKVNLNTRGMGVERTCNLFSNHEETDAHVFRDCPFTARCWFGGLLGLHIESAKATTVRQWVMDYLFLFSQLDGHDDKRVTDFITTLWSI